MLSETVQLESAWIVQCDQHRPGAQAQRMLTLTIRLHNMYNVVHSQGVRLAFPF